MKRDDIIIQKAIIHILDGSVGMPVLSDRELECGPDLYDFFRAHLEKITCKAVQLFTGIRDPGRAVHV